MAWLDKARSEAPHRREIWLDLAEEFHGQADWLNLLWACTSGIEKTHRTGSYLDDNRCWGFRLFDLAAIAAWHLNVMDRAVDWGKKALDLDPDNTRLENNLELFVRRRGGRGFIMSGWEPLIFAGEQGSVLSQNGRLACRLAIGFPGNEGRESTRLR